ncbi:MAG TPA: trypsin-like peptidase domain-containing protein [Gaiellaceae bacterium]|jgi:S1-C subfamily serine protease|nr:trypsin-like peptidase domain-containing protein [Gaiellaceae bacterium]
MRPAVIAVVALVAAALGSGSTLFVGKAAGWIGESGSETGTTTVVVERDADGGARSTATPLVGNTFDPARIFERTSRGVVTIYAAFPGARTSQGSGFVVSAAGHILTNSHVITNVGETQAASTVRGATHVFVVFADSDRIPAKIVGWDLYNDTGVLKVDPRDHALSPVPLGDSNAVVVGEPVAAIGSPFGNENSLSVGVVSAVARSIPSLTSRYRVSNAIQIDAPINHGNSGGPLLDARGRVIGINAQIRSESGTAEGVGFAIPINSARRSMQQLIASGRVAYAYVGITTRDVTPALSRKYALGAERGALIEEVVPEGPAARAGVRGSEKEELFNGEAVPVGGDVIVALAGERVERADDVARIVTERLRPGQTVPVQVLRGGKGTPRTLRLRLVERPTNPGG